MAKAKGSFKPEDLKKYYFWILLPLLVVLVFVFTFIAKGKIKKAYVEKTTAIESAKKGADDVASTKNHPNDQTIKAIKDETKLLADNVYDAWLLVYDDQKLRNRWPRQLSTEFLDLVENQLKFADPIGRGKPYLLEDYGFFIGRHLPDLLKEMNRRRCQVQEYKLLKKAEMTSIGMAGTDERFWPVYVEKDANGADFLYIGIHSDPEDEKSPLADAYLYNLDQDVVAVLDDQELKTRLLAKTEHEHYYHEVDPFIDDPKNMIYFGVQTNDLQGIVQAIAMAGMEGGGAGGGALLGPGAGMGMGGGMSPMGGGGPGGGGPGGGSARGSMTGDMMGMGGGLAGLGVGNIPGDGVDPALDQIPGSTLEEIGGGLGGGTGMTGRGAGAGMGGPGGGTGMTGRGAGVGAGGLGGGRGAGAGAGAGAGRGGRMAGGASPVGLGGGMSGDSLTGGSVEDPSWSIQMYPGLPPYKQRRRIIGNVDWPDPEIYTLPTWEADANPTSIEIWYAQQTLWVYEALIRVIAETNKEYPDNISKAPIKCVEQMLIGQNAAVEWLSLSQTIGDLTGKSASQMGAGGTGDLVGGAGMSVEGGGASGEGAFTLSGTAEEQALTKILTGRFIGDDNKPLKAEDKPPFAEFNKMPVCLKLAVDQRRIPDLLVSCANSAMPIDVKHVRVCPDNNVPFVMPIPLENMGGEGGASGMMGDMMGMMGGMSGLGGGPGGGMGGMSGPGGADGGQGGRGSMNGAGGMGMDGGVAVGRSEISQTEYGVDTIRIEVYGVINIYNEPNKKAFATGAAAEEADSEVESILSGSDSSETSSDDETSDDESGDAPENAPQPAEQPAATESQAPAEDEEE